MRTLSLARSCRKFEKSTAWVSNHWKIALLVFPIIGNIAANARDFSFKVPDATRVTHNLSWYQAETINLTVYGRAMAGADAVIWDVVSATNQLLHYISATTTVSEATNAIFHLPPPESNLYPGSYFGWVRAVWLNGQDITNQEVLVRQSIKVLYSPDSRYTAYRGPLTTPGIRRPVKYLAQDVIYDVPVDESGYTLVAQGQSPFTVRLPAAGENTDGLYYHFVKWSGDLIIHCSTNTSITGGAFGGRIYNDLCEENDAHITLMLIGIQWQVVGFEGTWTTE